MVSFTKRGLQPSLRSREAGERPKTAETMSGVSMLQHFEVYQKARVSFVQAVADAATRPTNIEVMQNAGVMQLLKPLLLDNVGAPAAPRPRSGPPGPLFACAIVAPANGRTQSLRPTPPPHLPRLGLVSKSNQPRYAPPVRFRASSSPRPSPSAVWQTTARTSPRPSSGRTSCRSSCTPCRSRTGS